MLEWLLTADAWPRWLMVLIGVLLFLDALIILAWQQLSRLWRDLCLEQKDIYERHIDRLEKDGGSHG